MITMNFRAPNDRTGEILKTVTTTDGTYEVSEDEAGNTYCVEIMADGYFTDYFDFKMLKGRKKRDFYLTPELKANEILRIVMSWGEYPTDVDLHVQGINSDAGVHVFYSNKVYSKDGNNVVTLDRDITNSYGPETMTVLLPGIDFICWCEDFSGRRSNIDATDMGKSPVNIKIWKDDGNVYEFNINSSFNDRTYIWNIFKFENGQVTFIDEYLDIDGYKLSDGTLGTEMIPALLGL